MICDATPCPLNSIAVPTNSIEPELGGRFSKGVSQSFFKIIPAMVPFKNPKCFLSSFY